MKTIRNIIGAAVLLGMASCSLDEPAFDPVVEDSERKPIVISGTISQEYATRANDTGFCNGDVVGIYIVDYDGETPGTLLNEGNRADNLRFTFDEAAYKWNPAYEIYWKDKNTHIDIYGYYPWGSPEDVENYVFEVEKDQRREAANGQMGGYEASDFLWGKAEDNAPAAAVIHLGFNHMMASARITLAEGIGFEAGEWAAAQKQVIVLNTARKSSINLKTGSVKASDEIPTTGTIPYKDGDDYRAIIVPQTVPADAELISVTIDGESYFLKKSEDFTYYPGKQHNFTITVNKRAAGGGLEFVLTSESITVWENDPVSHDAIAREYVVINVPEAGTLDKCIEEAGKDLTKVRNLKLTGQINSRDFAVMREQMERLSAINLKEIIIVGVEEGVLDGVGYNGHSDDEIPIGALAGKETLTSLVLPDRLKSIASNAFENCSNLSGSLIIPEGVENIGYAAFKECTSLTGTLSLPSTLKRLGRAKGYDPYWDGVFMGCNFVCELKIPDSVVEIGMGAFRECKNLYGELRLPDGLELIGPEAFARCEKLSGSLVIPQNVKTIPQGCFDGTWLGGTLTLHDGIISIGTSAFANTGLKGELRLPKDLEVISHTAFYNCDFSGVLVLPENLYTIGDRAFAYNWRLMGTLEIPENVISIGAGAFAKCRSLEGVIFPEGLESIRSESSWYEDGGAFQDCFGIGRIVCKGTIPAYVMDEAFHGVAKDNFTLEVPESAIQQYQTAVGWKDFKRISAYRNLVIRPSMATAINTTVTRDLVLTADDEWYVESQPDWVTLDKTSGKGKTEIKLTFAQMPAGSEPREGEVVFMLKGQDYRTRCKVTQYDYEYAEDEFITFQEATKGNGKLNIVLLGDGYNAKDISDGKLIENVTEAYGHFFDIEPYKTYKDYFNVYTAVSVSPESGVGSVNTIIYNKFNTSAKGGVTLSGRNGDSDFNYIMKYICDSGKVASEDLNQTLVIMVPNTYDYGGICYMWDEGFAIAYCPMSDYGYPLDFRGVVQHEAGGHGFGKLGDEYIYHNAFIDACSCTCCGHVFEFNLAKAKGWYDNLSLTGKMSEVPWSHLIFHEKYSEFVDIFEGGYMHNRGVYRSEQNSCMNNDIPYYSTISRESIVKRIKAYAGEEYSFEDFVANDVIEVEMTETKSSDNTFLNNIRASQQHEPVFMGKLPSLK
ncbi:MAG: leucine-rich repeat protein [Bacteroidales bacterium]|nr:leucine-rich repeat protein [Bacteroidales bacterium]